MDERILFLTGRLAHDSLCREIEGLAKRGFSYRVHELGLQVAGLMTADMIKRRLQAPGDAQRIIVPGLCGGDVEALSQTYGVPVERGPKDLKDLPEYFGTAGRRPDLSERRVTILAEIVDAPHMDIEQIIERAAAYRADGADVIDLGCLPGVAFPHLEESVSALKHEGHAVSVDSLDPPELTRGAAAGADYLLSLKESTLHVAGEAASTPVLIPEQPSDLDSLYRAAETLAAQGRRFLLDPILEPIHFGFTESLLRYHAVRWRYPDAEIMMGIGNLTELTDADTTGVTAVLMGVVSELDIGAVLTTEVSPHAHTSVREVDIARRIMWAAKRDGNLPRRYHSGLMALKDRKPFPYTCEEVAQIAAAVKDPSFRIQLTREGIHVYNRDGRQLATDPFELYPGLAVDEDASHAFYLGVELGRAQIAWQLGKRYLQDNELEWGVSVHGAATE
jgi:dihydropteroate synthase-like protein